MTNAASVSLPDTLSMICSALANANTTFTTFSTPNPKSRRTCAKSPDERLMISPDDMVR